MDKWIIIINDYKSKEFKTFKDLSINLAEIIYDQKKIQNISWTNIFNNGYIIRTFCDVISELSKPIHIIDIFDIAIEMEIIDIYY